MDPAPSYSPIDVTDVLAVVLLVLGSVRRMDVKLAEPADYPHVPLAAFDDWKRSALRAYSIWTAACALKVALNTAWFFGMRDRAHPMLLATVGAALFLSWMVALVVAWRLSSNARRRQNELGIVLKRRSDRATDASGR